MKLKTVSVVYVILFFILGVFLGGRFLHIYPRSLSVNLQRSSADATLSGSTKDPLAGDFFPPFGIEGAKNTCGGNNKGFGCILYGYTAKGNFGYIYLW